MTGVLAKTPIPLFDLELTEAHRAAVDEVLRSGWLTMGPKIQEFEAAFAEHLGVKHVVAVNSCTAALHLAYRGADIGPGDEVIFPAITFAATAAAVRHCGGVPVAADIIGPHDLGMDPADVEAAITPRTKAVCVVHYAGYPAAIEELRTLCEERGLALIEDAAHAPSARTVDGDAMLGTIGLASAFSFFSNKVLSCGEGGALATNDDELAAQARLLRSHCLTSTTWDRHRGHAPGYDVIGTGFNYRLDEVRAALLLARLPDLEADIAQRRELVRRYRELLSGIDGVIVPFDDDLVECSSCYVMPIVLEDAELRDPLRERMREDHAVQTSVLYPALHELTAYREEARRPLPRAEFAGRAQLTLPLFPHLGEERQDRVVEALAAGLEQLAG
jgi:dTDP-4-amino-4,6-dideoxygalactose transaminase